MDGYLRLLVVETFTVRNFELQSRRIPLSTLTRTAGYIRSAQTCILMHARKSKNPTQEG